MIPVPRKLSWFIPTTYFLIVLLPLLLVSLLWLNNVMNINDIQKDQVERRFIDLHKQIVKHEVEHVLTKIEEIRSDSRKEFMQRGEEYLSITLQILQALDQDEGSFKSLDTLRHIALDELKPILGSSHFDSIFILEQGGDVLFSSRQNQSNYPINIEQSCITALIEQPGSSKVCRVTTKVNEKYSFIVQYFSSFDFLILIGISDKQVDERAKHRALTLIKDMHYGDHDNGYMFTYQYDGICLTHLSPEMIGRNIRELTNLNGTELFDQLLKASKQGGGYVSYKWERYEQEGDNNRLQYLNSKESQEKIIAQANKVSYTMAYPDWEWIIGTGFYLDDLYEAQPIQDDLVSNMLKQTVLYGVLIIVALYVINAWLVFLTVRGFDKEITHFSKFFLRKADEAKPIDVHQLYFTEFKDLARSANVMLESRQKAEQKLIDVFNCIDDVIYLSDPETYELLFVNDAFKSKFGEDALGRKCYRMLQGKDQPCDFCTNHLIFGANLGNVHVWEFENVQDKRWYSINDRAIEWHDGHYVRFEQARDITEQKLAELERENYREKLELAVKQRTTELMARTDQLEQANRDLEGFSYSISHDLRSPLRAIDGFLTILKDEYGDSLDDEGLRLFGIVQNNACKMGELIDDILAFSRAGRVDLVIQQVDMEQLVKNVCESVKEQYQDSNIVVHYNNLPAVKADPSAIRQVIFNLINNAVKFSVSKDPVVIEVKGEVHDGYIRYSISDNGIGFSNEYKDKLFVMFQRLQGMDEFEGTGVGLAIVERFIAKHGGRVDAHGVQGEGATFSFELPLKKTA